MPRYVCIARAKEKEREKESERMRTNANEIESESKVLNFCQPFDLSILVLLSLASYISLANNPRFGVKIYVVENLHNEIAISRRARQQNIYNTRV